MKISPEPELVQDVQPSLSQKVMEENLVLPYFQEGKSITILMDDPLRLTNIPVHFEYAAYNHN